jgi:hypothetical protein
VAARRLLDIHHLIAVHQPPPSFRLGRP